MNFPPSKSAPETAYSPFFALWSVLVALCILQVVYVVNDFSERSQIKAALAELQPILVEADKINKTTEAVGKGLVNLANAGSAEARKIVNELQIKVNAPAAEAQPQKPGR